MCFDNQLLCLPMILTVCTNQLVNLLRHTFLDAILGLRQLPYFIPFASITPMIVLLWSLAHLPLTNSQINCSKAPDNGTQNICNQIQQWESGVKVNRILFL